MKPPVERMGLEKKHPTGKNRSEGKVGGFVLGWSQNSGSRTQGLALSPRSCKLQLVQAGQAAPLSTVPFSSCQGIVSPPAAPHTPAPSWLGWKQGSQKQFPLGKMQADGEGRQALGSPVLRWS